MPVAFHPLTMPIVEVSLPNKVDNEIDRLVEQDEFMNRDQAIENLLSKGISVYDTGEDAPPEEAEDVFTQVVDDQHDPALDSD